MRQTRRLLTGPSPCFSGPWRLGRGSSWQNKR
jgi:hypothetical protein